MRIKPPCGYGDIIPVYVRGHWLFTSNCPDFRDYADGITEGFTWQELIDAGMADREFRCPDVFEAQYRMMTPEEIAERQRLVHEKWERYRGQNFGRE